MDMNKKEEVLKRANFILQDGVKNRDSLFHTLVMSSLCNGEIESRVMVLREFNEKNRTLRFHSDYRSNKIKELEKDNKTTVIGYDPNLKVQIRLIGETKVNYRNEHTKKSWESSQSISKKCYSVKVGSSAQIENPKDVDFDIKSINVEDGYKNFCTLNFNYNILEFLYLQRSGHRRCRFSWNLRGEVESLWLVP